MSDQTPGCGSTSDAAKRHAESKFVDIQRLPHPTPCPDCGRTYLNGENVTLGVPTPVPGGTRVAWSGCVDCWVERSNPFRQGGQS